MQITFFFLRFSKSGDSARQIRQTPDWSENAVANDHLWVPTSVSGDFCYVGDSDCTVSFILFYFYFRIQILYTIEHTHSGVIVEREILFVKIP